MLQLFFQTSSQKTLRPDLFHLFAFIHSQCHCISSSNCNSQIQIILKHILFSANKYDSPHSSKMASNLLPCLTLLVLKCVTHKSGLPLHSDRDNLRVETKRFVSIKSAVKLHCMLPWANIILHTFSDR